MPISRLRPLDVTVKVPDRKYTLGDAIEITIEVTPNRDCEVREARTDLMLEERWIEQYSTTIEKPVFTRVTGTQSSYMRQTGTVTETRNGTDEHKATHSHGSVVFLADETLRSGKPSVFVITLHVKPEQPENAGRAKMKWWLQTTIDVAGARDIKRRDKVRMVV